MVYSPERHTGGTRISEINFWRCFDFHQMSQWGDPLIALVYIDDITLFGILEAIQDLKHTIAMRYKVTNLGEIKQFLGLHIGGYSESSDICTCRLFCLYFIVHVDICCMRDSL